MDRRPPRNFQTRVKGAHPAPLMMVQVRFLSQFLLNVDHPELWMPWVERSIKVLIILTAAWFVTRVARRLLIRLRHQTVTLMERHGRASDVEMEKRAATIVAALAKLVSSLVWLVAIVTALTELTFNIQPLLAGLGVAGLALGLGAQTLIKDWLGGLFLLIEDQIRIGDLVTVGPVTGSVEEINLRTTVLRSENGAVHVIPNGSIAQISNLTRDYSYFVFEVTVAYGANVDRALEALAKAGQEVSADPGLSPLILGPLEIFGVDRFIDRGVLIRGRIKTLPSQRGKVGAEFNRRVVGLFSATGVQFVGLIPAAAAPPPTAAARTGP
jgi:small-conductance mechanosensitive channel